MRRRAAITAALAGLSALAAGLVLGNSAAAGDPEPKPATWMTVRGLTDRATLASICGTDSNGGGICVETDDPFVGEVPVEGRDVVRVRTRPGAGRVKAYLLRLRANDQIAEWIDWNHRATEVDGSNGQRWRFRLPQGLEDANAIHLFVHYPGGAPYPGGYTVHQATYTSRVVHD